MLAKLPGTNHPGETKTKAILTWKKNWWNQIPFCYLSTKKTLLANENRCQEEEGLGTHPV